MQSKPPTPIIERIRYGMYGAAAGLFMGVLIGWMFHGFVSVLVRLGLLLVVVIPVCLAIYFWFKVDRANRAARQDSGIREAEWWDSPGPKQ